MARAPKGLARTALSAQVWLKAIAFVLAANAVWTLVTGTWGAVLICLGAMALLAFAELCVCQRAVLDAKRKTLAALDALAREAGADPAIGGYGKYLGLFLLRKYALAFCQPLVEAALVLRRAGRD